MNSSDLDRIEDALGIALPDAYRQVMLDYPFAPHSNASNFLLSIDVAELISENQRLRREGFFRSRCWPATFYALGWDGCGNYYFIRADDSDETVYFADHESEFNPETINLLKEQYCGMRPYLEYVREVEEEIRLDEEDVPDDQPAPLKDVRPWWKRLLRIP